MRTVAHATPAVTESLSLEHDAGPAGRCRQCTALLVEELRVLFAEEGDETL